ncbi:MAG: TolC family protein [Pseudomonadota bacterium]
MKLVKPLSSRWGLPWCMAGVLGSVLAWPAQARCLNETRIDEPVEMSRGTGTGDASAPRLGLQGMVREAIRRSNAIGAAKLLAEAAASDIEETKAAGRPQANLSASLSGAHTSGDDLDTYKGQKNSVGVYVGAPLYDGGRIAELTRWRTQLAEAARLGQLSAQEQIALQTVSLALERSRYRMQSQVYGQYARKMSCLVEALEQIVSADRGRASELVQARKTEKQAQIQQAQAQSTVRQIESRLARFIGDVIPSSEGLPSLLLDVPNLNELYAEAERSTDIGQLDAQAIAAQNFAQSVTAGHKPQVNWVLSAVRSGGGGNTSSVLAGVNLTVPLINPGTEHTVRSAQKRAEAVRLQRADALEARRFRMTEVYEQATASFARARQYADVARDSDRLRGFTLQQWQQLGRRSLFDVMSTESEHYSLRVAYLNSLHDGQQANALLRSLGLGLNAWLQ